jgi:hypothetical protein
MIDRDILLIIVGGVIGLVSSLATLFASYLVEGMRLRRQWERDDRVLMKQKREELADILARARPEQAQAPKVEE